jgi:hypothetical protein
MQCRYAGWHYVQSRYAECRHAECRHAECRHAECRHAECRHAECRYAECCYAECVVKLIIVMLSVVMLSVTMLTVAAPLRWFCLDKKVQKGVGVLANSKRLKTPKKISSTNLKKKLKFFSKMSDIKQFNSTICYKDFVAARSEFIQLKNYN